jgi:outer membrane lipoprotein-sorting protein
MKKILTCTLCLFFTMSLASLWAQTAEEINQRMIKAQGGKKVYESIKDMTMKATLEIIPQGLEADLVVYKKEPNKRRSEIAVMGVEIISGYDGTTAWATNQQTFAIEELSGEQAENAKREALPVIAPLYPQKYGLSHELKGKETLEGKEYFVLLRNYPNDFTVTIYVDAQTYLPYKTLSTVVGSDGLEHDVETIQSDYKEVNGLLMAYTTKQIVDGLDYLSVVVNEVTFNTGLEDSIFVMEK